MQWAIGYRNSFVEAFVPRGMTHTLSPQEMQRYRGVQPSPAARVGVAVFPTKIRSAPLLNTLQRTVPKRLGAKPALIVWGPH